MKQKRPARKKLAAKKPTPPVNVDERVFKYPVAPNTRGNETNINNQPDQVNAGKNLMFSFSSSSSSSSSSDNEGSFDLEMVSSGPDEPATVSVSKRGSQKKGEVSRQTTNALVMPPRRLVSNVVSSRGSGSGSKFMPPKANGLNSINRKELPSSKELSQDPRYNKLELKTSLAVIKKAMKMDEAIPFNAPLDPVSQGLPASTNYFAG